MGSSVIWWKQDLNFRRMLILITCCRVVNSVSLILKRRFRFLSNGYPSMNHWKSWPPGNTEPSLSLIHISAQSLEEVVREVKEVTRTINQISDASIQQADSIVQVTQGIDQISSVVQTNSATAEESAAASEELSGQSQVLKNLVNQFKIKDYTGTPDASPLKAPDEKRAERKPENGQKY